MFFTTKNICKNLGLLKGLTVNLEIILLGQTFLYIVSYI
jgi:hypothetical protein